MGGITVITLYVSVSTRLYYSTHLVNVDELLQNLKPTFKHIIIEISGIKICTMFAHTV